MQKKNKKIHKYILHAGALVALISFLLLCLVSVFYYKFEPELLTRISFYLDLANPTVKMVNIVPGLRKEEVADVISEKLGWQTEQKEQFINMHLALGSDNFEGRYFPKTYLINKEAGPIEVGEKMFEEFSKKVESIEKKSKNKLINQDTAIKIASIIQREAAGKHDMALISGIIWNRIWLGMKLEIDATLQYAKGTEEDGWWRQVRPEDKKIDSEYNTYMHKGLPPGAIANPSANAIFAAYNPESTKCIFYIHDKKRKIHCSETYEEHKKNIEIYL